jgi:transposase
VAEALNIHPFMLSRWKKELRDGIMVDNDKEARSVNELNDAKKKIKTLEKELKRLREENTVLKKAERIFPGKK